MRTLWRGGLVCTCLGLAGCAEGQLRDFFTPLNQVNDSRRNDASAAPAASAQAATRVHSVGSAIVAANGPDLSAKPVFLTLGLPQPMIFHRASGEVVLSEGLVDKCATDAELAAVICHELGKMAAAKVDRESVRPSDADLLSSPRIAPDVVGASQSADMTGLAESAMLARRATRETGRGESRPQRADPRVLARNFLVKAGHSTDDLTRVEPLLKDAEENAEKREVMRGR
ncbi:MAG TPA: M48 family metalloprotease [Gemmataceae bacterium]|nr:M48 family metalloprotease [Gemmataceae bacterium]